MQPDRKLFWRISRPASGTCPGDRHTERGSLHPRWFPVNTLSLAEAARQVPPLKPILCHGLKVAARLGVPRFAAHDILELFVFVYQARFCLPTM